MLPRFRLCKRQQRQSVDIDEDAWENEFLERLVALNHERAEEEANGKIRWLRPEFQNPDGDGDTETQWEEQIEQVLEVLESLGRV